MKKGDIILGKDLKPGMAVQRTDFGLAKLVIDINLKDPFYEGDPSIHFFDLNDAYYGPCSTTLDPEGEFEILIAQNTEEYEKMVDGVRDQLNANARACFESIEELGELTEEYIK